MLNHHHANSDRHAYLSACQREGLLPSPPGRYRREKPEYTVHPVQGGEKVKVVRHRDRALMILRGAAASDFLDRIRGILDPGCLNWIIRQYDPMFSIR